MTAPRRNRPETVPAPAACICREFAGDCPLFVPMRARALLLHMQRICSKTRPAPVRQAGAVAIHSLFRRFRRSRTREIISPHCFAWFFHRRHRRRNSKITAGNSKITAAEPRAASATVEVLCIRWQAGCTLFVLSTGEFKNGAAQLRCRLRENRNLDLQAGCHPSLNAPN